MTRWGFRLLALALPTSIALAHIALGLVLTAVVLRAALGEFRWRGTRLDRFIGIYLVVCLISGIQGISPVRSMAQFASLWHIAIYWLAVNAIEDRAEMKTLIGLLIAGASLNAAYGILQHAAGQQPRAMGFYGHYMTYAGQIQMIMVLTASIALALSRGRERMTAGLALVVLGTGLLLSYTRSAWLGFLAGLGGVALSRGPKTLLAGAAALAGVVVLVVVFQPALGERMRTIPDTSRSGSNEERLRIWGATLEMIRDNPVLGVGGGGFRPALESYRERWNLPSRSHAHDNYLQQTAEHGLVGLAAFLSIWVVLFKTAWAAWKNPLGEPERGWLAGGAMAVLAFLTAGLFESNFGDSEVAMLMWFLVGLVLWVTDRAPTVSRARNAGPVVTLGVPSIEKGPETGSRPGMG